MGGPAADNNNLRAQLEAIVKGTRNADIAAAELLSSLLAFGDARYQEGRDDAAKAIEADTNPNESYGQVLTNCYAAKLARGEH